MQSYEITCDGFDGSTDMTDHKVIWLQTGVDLKKLQEVCQNLRATIQPIEDLMGFGFDLKTNSLVKITKLLEKRTRQFWRD